MKTRLVAVLAVGALFSLTMTPALAEGDPEAGERGFRQCAACHDVAEGVHKTGPSLHGIIGRTAGTAEGFRYSPDIVAAGEAGLVWDEETLFEYLEDPREFLGELLDTDRVRTRMPNRYPSEELRRDIIAYLKVATE